jgi:hypothetical protein
MPSSSGKDASCYSVDFDADSALMVNRVVGDVTLRDIINEIGWLRTDL